MKLDSHTETAIDTAENLFFVINRRSYNQNLGLLVGTMVKRIAMPVSKKSDMTNYGMGDYWSVSVECPNGETRKVCCDVLSPATREDFERQKLMFNYYTCNLLDPLNDAQTDASPAVDKK